MTMPRVTQRLPAWERSPNAPRRSGLVMPLTTRRSSGRRMLPKAGRRMLPKARRTCGRRNVAHTVVKGRGLRRGRGRKSSRPSMARRIASTPFGNGSRASPCALNCDLRAVRRRVGPVVPFRCPGGHLPQFRRYPSWPPGGPPAPLAARPQVSADFTQGPQNSLRVTQPSTRECVRSQGSTGARAVPDHPPIERTR